MAASVYAMDEPVVDTGSVLQALAGHNEGAIHGFDPGPDGSKVEVEVDSGTAGSAWSCVHVSPGPNAPARCLRPAAIVLCAGEGNETLLRRGGDEHPAMQRRPLQMILLRGALPPLYAHCVVGGRTRLTVTASDVPSGERVWQLGGEIAERLADETDPAVVLREARAEIARWLPRLDRSRLELASYRAVRAEAQRGDHRRPSGVHVRRAAANVVVAWPTKMALAPLLAEEIEGEVRAIVGAPGNARAAADRWRGWSRPRVARYPWEEARWEPAR
jgi:hypothetical protein